MPIIVGLRRKRATKARKLRKEVLKALGGVSKNKVENKGKEKYFYYQGEGHWKRNCSKFLESIKEKDKIEEGETFSNLSIFKCSKSSSNEWVLDTSASSHICSSLQDLAS